MDFYSAVAQVIPVLLLALMFEARLVRAASDAPQSSRGFARTYTLVGVAGGLLGEVAALLALDSKPHAFLHALTWAGVILLVVMLTTELVMGVFGQSRLDG